MLFVLYYVDNLFKKSFLKVKGLEMPQWLYIFWLAADWQPCFLAADWQPAWNISQKWIWIWGRGGGGASLSQMVWRSPIWKETFRQRLKTILLKQCFFGLKNVQIVLKLWNWNGRQSKQKIIWFSKTFWWTLNICFTKDKKKDIQVKQSF